MAAIFKLVSLCPTVLCLTLFVTYISVIAIMSCSSILDVCDKQGSLPSCYVCKAVCY